MEHNHSPTRSRQLLSLLSENSLVTCLFPLELIFLNVGDASAGRMRHPASPRSRNPPQYRDIPGQWDDAEDEMMLLKSRLHQQLAALVLQLDVPRSFPLSPHFPVTGSRAEQTGLLSAPALLLPFIPITTLMVKGTSSSSVVLPGSGWLSCTSTTGRALGEGASLEEATTMQLPRVIPVLPFSPNVPEMDGCSPVNFLGVFCFLPDSKERNRERFGQITVLP